MKRLFLLSLLLLLATALSAQNQSFNLQTGAPPPVPSAGAITINPNFSQGTQTLYYWVVARYPIGSAIPTGPAVATGTPGVGNLTATTYVSVSWTTVPGATGYDVVRSTTPAYPAPCTACAVVLNTILASVNDTGGALLAYPPAGLGAAQPANANFSINNRDATAPFINVQTNANNNRMGLLPTSPVGSRCVQTSADGTTLTEVGVPCSTTSGTVTSVGLVLPGFITVTGSPVIAAGTLTGTLATQAPNLAFVGPNAGPAAAPTFRALTATDVPAAGTAATASALTANQGTTTTVLHGNAAGTPAFASVTASDFGAQTANLVLAGPAAAGPSTPTFRALVAADIPAGVGAPNSLSDTYTNIAATACAAGNSGQMAFVTSGIYHYARCNGTIWQFFYFGTVVSPPDSAAGTWFNQGGATVTQTEGAVYLDVPSNAGQNLRGLYYTLGGSATYTITAVFDQFSTWNGNYPGCSLILTDTAAFRSFEYLASTSGVQTDITLYPWANATTVGGGIGTSLDPPLLNRYWLRVVENGVNRIWYYSYDGLRYYLLVSEATGAGITPTHYGFAGRGLNTNITCTLVSLVKQ